MEAILSIRMDDCSWLNLGADYFRKPEFRYLDEKSLEIKLESNILSDMINRGMGCLLRLNSRFFCEGRIGEVSKANGRIRILCELNPPVSATENSRR